MTDQPTPTAAPPTLGQIADKLRPWRDAGLTYGSLTYAAAQVWPGVLSGNPDATITQLRSDLAERDTVIVDLSVANADLEQRIAEREQTIASRDAELDELHAELSARDASVVEQISSREDTIAELRAALAAQPASDDVKVLRTRAFALVAEANGLHRRVAERDQHIAELRRRVADLEQQNRQLAAAAAHNDRTDPTDPMDGGRPADTIPRLTIPSRTRITLALPVGVAVIVEAVSTPEVDWPEQ